MEMYKIQICVGEIISGAITKVDDNVVGKKPIKMGGNKRNRRREKWIKGLAHERRLSDKVGSHCPWTIMDSKLEVWNMSVLNCKWKSHKYR